MRRLLPELSLHLLAALIALSMMAASAFSLWRDGQIAWVDAERTSRHLLTALSQDIAGNLAELDTALREISVDVADQDLLALPPLARHRILFDRARTGGYMGGILVLDE